MANAAKRKGDLFERQIRDYLAEVVPCERIPAGATSDIGDLWLPAPVVVQCKNQRELRFGAWLDETEVQTGNAGKEYGWVVAKRRGVTDPGGQYALCSTRQLRKLLAALGG